MKTIETLTALALVDSISFETLLISIWLLIAPGQVKLGRLLVHSVTVVAAYFIQLALSIGLVILSHATEPGIK